ncbi:MAG TPA: MarR family transcriptional regulator [Actinomycetes bacterium]|nr:MarR family transcriptional regulator [Actinomycetes bacterium]
MTADERWLDAGQQQTWRAYLAMNQIIGEALDRQMQRDAGMPHAYYIVLAMLSERADKTMTMSELARMVGYSPSRLSHAVARLEEEGWVRRTRHPTDRRTTLAELTDEGMRTVVAAAPGHVAEVRRVLFDRLTREQSRCLADVAAAVMSGCGEVSRFG